MLISSGILEEEMSQSACLTLLNVLPHSFLHNIHLLRFGAHSKGKLSIVAIVPKHSNQIVSSH